MRISLLAVADQTSSVPIARIRPVAPTSTQSSRGTATRLRAIGQAADGQDGHQSSPFRDGGRIEPSRANVGRLDGGMVPGMAAFFGFTFSPLIP